MGMRWYVAYPLSTRHVEELMEERGVDVDHSTINRWVIKYSPQLEEAFHRRKRPVWVNWRMDETYVKVKGQWCSLYRAVDKTGQTIDFLLTEERDEQAAKRFLTKAICRHGVPEKITIDGSAANEAAIKSYNKDHSTAITIRKIQYLNNMVEMDHMMLQTGYGFQPSCTSGKNQGVTCLVNFVDRDMQRPGFRPTPACTPSGYTRLLPGP
jgi:transposase-like protein